MLMTEAQAQAILQRLYEADEEVPSTSDDDYTTRRGLLNAGIQKWETEDDWQELYTTLSAAADGTKTTTASTAQYSAPTDFARPLGYLRLVGGSTSTYYRLEPTNRVQLYDNDSSNSFYYVTGVPGAYKINIHPTPDTSSVTIAYEYYKSATQLSATTSTFEMRDPYYAIYYALSELQRIDGDDNQQALIWMDDCLRKMKVKNYEMGYYQFGGAMPDPFYETNTGGFGA